MNDGEDEEEEREELQEEVEEADQTGVEPGRVVGDEECEAQADTETDENHPDCAELLNTLDSPGSPGHPGGLEGWWGEERFSYKYSSTFRGELELTSTV